MDWDPGSDLSCLGAFLNLGVPFGNPYNKEYNILGSILGDPYFGKLPLTMR